jgi:transposase-like protein
MPEEGGNTAVRKKNIEAEVPSRVCWDSLESAMRLKVQGWIQDLLEEEVTEFLGRRKSARRAAVDAVEGYRNGRGKPRRLTLSVGTVTLRRPKLRGLEERFESRLMPLFARRTEEVNALLPELYLHGLAQGDMDLALRGLLGDEAPISANTVARLKEKWQTEHESWSSQRLDELEVVYLWVDGIDVKAGLEQEKAAVLVVIAGLANGRKVIVSLTAGHRESESSWAGVLRALKERGLRCPKLVIGAGHWGIWSGVRQIFPKSEEQRCWNHRLINVLDKLPQKQHGQAKLMLKSIPQAATRAEATRLKEKFQAWCRKQAQPAAAELIDRDWDRLVTFYEFPEEHWSHLRTSNVIESPFAALRLRTHASKRFKKVDNATAIMFTLLLVAEKKFRRLNAPERMREVFLGKKFVNGKSSSDKNREAAA